MARRRINRQAPDRWANAGHLLAPEHQGLWRGLVSVWVPTPNRKQMYDLAQASAQTTGPDNGSFYAGGVLGPVMHALTFSGGGLTSASAQFPRSGPFSIFACVVKRNSTASIESLIGDGGTASNGWTFQLNYGLGEIGLTRWGSADYKATALGAVPTLAPAGIGVVYNNSTARFFLNGRFANVSVAAITNSVLTPRIGANALGAAGISATSLHIVYVWNRLLADGELQNLWRDPWAGVRPRASVHDMSLTSTTVARVTQAALEALIALPVQTRATQVLVEALITAPTTPSTARISSLVLEALTQPDAAARLTQLALEVLHQPTPGVRSTQVTLESLTQPDPTARITQLSLEALVQVGALTPTYTGQLFPRGSPPPF
jgi:hypothetical protein